MLEYQTIDVYTRFGYISLQFLNIAFKSVGTVTVLYYRVVSVSLVEVLYEFAFTTTMSIALITLASSVSRD